MNFMEEKKQQGQKPRNGDNMETGTVKLTQTDLKMINEQHKSGKSIKEIADTFGVHPQMIYNKRRALKLKTQKRNKKSTTMNDKTTKFKPRGTSAIKKENEELRSLLLKLAIKQAGPKFYRALMDQLRDG